MPNSHIFFLILLVIPIASGAAAISTDAVQIIPGATPNAILLSEVSAVQAGVSDKDVVAVLNIAVTGTCPADRICTSTVGAIAGAKPLTVNDWFVMHDNASALGSIVIWLVIIGLIVFVLARKSSSTK